MTAVAAVALAVVVPRLADATPYTILTGSMKPDLPPGALVVVRPAERISLGDVITYQLKSGEDTVVTHRVVGQSVNAKGETTFLTQGDANDTPDFEPVRPVQLKGKVWYSVPYLGHVNNALTGNQRQKATYGVGGLLALYAAYMFISAVLDKRKPPQFIEEVAS